MRPSVTPPVTCSGRRVFIAIAAALRPGPWRGLGEDGPIAARLVLVAASLALLLAFLPLAGVAWSYGMRYAAFPVVADLTRAGSDHS
jgi:hypothetical protein